MKNPLHLLIIILVISNFYLLATSRLRALVRCAGLQGFVLGAFPFVMHAGYFSVHTVILSVLSIGIKGVAIPLLLLRALRGVTAEREVAPRIGYTISIALCICMTALSFWVGRLIGTQSFFPSGAMLSLALCMGLCGLFLITTRSQAITQVIGYLVLENGIYVFGISLPVTQSLLVEMGVLLDMLVGVFIMGIVILRINQEFDTISTQSLQALKQ
jgi:hydrogenase-4 component E